MVYNVIGLMSGSSLDGLDIAFVHLTETRGKWTFELQHTACVPYPVEWLEQLKEAAFRSAPEFLRLHTAYGHYLGAQVKQFMETHDLEHQVHFIASHGHTVFHDPATRTTGQIGDGAAIAADTGLPVISDLRALDVALGGQGAPIVPIGDKLLFGEYDYWLNLGGIANITVKTAEGLVAFDICSCNQVLDYFALENGLAYDAGGALAASGTLLPEPLQRLESLSYFRQPAPKSLSNDFSREAVIPVLHTGGGSTADKLRTAVQHIAAQIAASIAPYHDRGTEKRLLATGGGALNTFLIQTLQEELEGTGIVVELPDERVIQFKEALVMALIGALRWREETNIISSVTGATRDSIGGALWMGHSFN